MTEFRCTCGKMLAKIKENTTTIPNEILDSVKEVKGIGKDSAELQIKCPRCKSMNSITV